jgi:hypothetical protein
MTDDKILISLNETVPNQGKAYRALPIVPMPIFQRDERIVPSTTVSVPIQSQSRAGRIETFDRVAMTNKARDEAIIAALQGILSELWKIRTEGIMVKK